MFTGLYTALVTPFKADESVDFLALEALVEDQITSGVDGLVILGTTGESPTIAEAEAEAIMTCVIKKAAGRTKIIVGTGSFCTAKSIKNSQKAQELGADGVMLVNPYYNKPTQKGLYEHFSTVAKSIDIPVILYNIKGRTGVNLETQTLLELAKIDNIVAVKEASGNMDQIREVIASVPEDFSVFSGDDALTFDLCRAGGHGIISVASNVIPRDMVAFVGDCLGGDEAKAQKLHDHFMPLFEDLFIETNPQPVKTAMAHLGQCEEVFRLPMTTMMPENKEQFLQTFQSYE